MTTTSPAGLAAGRWTADPACSPRLHGEQLGRTVTGTVPITEGIVEVDGAGRPGGNRRPLDLAAIDTGNTRRDKDLRKPKLLDLNRYPTMTFAADTITASPGRWRVTGQLAARNTSVQLAGDADVSGEGQSAPRPRAPSWTAAPWGSGHRRSATPSRSPSPRHSA